MADVKFGFERDAYNYEVVDQVTKVLSFFTGIGGDFTAHDVTKQVRIGLGPKIKVEHEDVRKAVHIGMSGRANYAQDNHPSGAILYKCVRKNPHTGKPLAPANTVRTLPLAVNIKIDPSTIKILKKNISKLKNVKPSKGLRKPDKRGSLTVPKKLIDNVCNVKQWGVKYQGNDRLLYPLTWSAPVGKGRYTKDKSGNIRVTKKHLPKSSTGLYKVEWTNQGEVLIQGV